MNWLVSRWWKIIILLVIFWVFRPFLHSFLISFIIYPLRLVLILLVIFGAWTIKKQFGPIRIVPEGENRYVLRAGKIPFFKLVSYFTLFVLVIIGIFLEQEIRYILAAHQIDFQVRRTLPQFEPIRLTPKQVAARYAQDSFQNPQEHLGDSQIVLIDGKLQRVFPRLPDGTLLYLIKKLSGFVTVEVDTLDRKVAISDQEFSLSEGVGIFDNLYYRLPLKRYFVNYASEPIYLKNDTGQWITVVPFIKYRSFPFTVPYWGGVMVVDSQGIITEYSPEQVQQISYLKGNRLFPKELVSYYTDAYAYKGGLLNKWFIHKNQTEIVHLPSDEQVIHVATTEGLKQVVVAEPFGRSFGIYKIFIFDATSGKPEVVEFNQQTQLTGPVAAADYIKKEFPTFDWNAFSLAEPRPVKINDDLYWLLTIAPNDSAGIAATVLLNAKTNAVLRASNESEVRSLLAGKTVETSPTVPGIDKNQQIKQQIESIQKQLDSLKQLVQ